VLTSVSAGVTSPIVLTRPLGRARLYENNVIVFCSVLARIWVEAIAIPMGLGVATRRSSFDPVARRPTAGQGAWSVLHYEHVLEEDDRGNTLHLSWSQSDGMDMNVSTKNKV
jgi:hypothetical protein